jgi:putative flippase GtrA
MTRLWKFSLIGSINATIGYGTTWMSINELNFSYLLSTLLGTAIALVMSYLLNSKYTFQHRIQLQAGLRFLLVIAISYVLYYWIGKGLVSLFSWQFPFLSKKMDQSFASLFSMPLQTLIHFLGHHFFTFRAKKCLPN